MATTVTQNRSEIGRLTWGNNAYSWGDYFVYSRKWSELGIFAHVCGISDDLVVDDTARKSPATFQVDSFGVAGGQCTGVPGRAIFETLSFTEQGFEKTFSSVQKEELIVLELASKAAFVAFSEVLPIAEHFKKQYNLSRSESLNISERREGLSIGQNHSETIGVNEVISNEMQFIFNSKFSMVESRFQKILEKNLETAIEFLDVRSTNFITKIQELITLNELPSKRPIKGFASSFGVDSFHSKGHNVVSLETLNVSDSISRTIKFIRTIAEALNVADLAAKSVQRNLEEELKVLDAFLKTADAAIADMVISTLTAGEDIDLQKFENLVTNGAMPGYSNWRDFIPGDYEYTKALFRVIIESSTADRAQIQELNVAVDVPDVNDRGTVNITNATAGGVVVYNRLYHVIPDVTLSARGGLANPTVPEFLVAPNLTGFTVRLRDTITGNYVTGSFSWSAHGY